MSVKEHQLERYWDLWVEERDPEAGDALVREYKPLVDYHVQRVSAGLPSNVSRDEIMSFGLQGLFDALTKFDRSRDLKFDTYASFRIRGSIMDGLRKEDWLPRSLRERAKKVEEVTRELEQKKMRNVTADEVAEELGIDVNDVYEAFQERQLSYVLSVDEQSSDEDEEGSPYMSVLHDEEVETPEEQTLKQELITELIHAIEDLTEREQLILSLFYTDGLTLTEIGKILDLSTSRISQIHTKALFKLRKVLASEVMNGGFL